MWIKQDFISSLSFFLSFGESSKSSLCVIPSFIAAGYAAFPTRGGKEVKSCTWKTETYDLLRSRLTGTAATVINAREICWACEFGNFEIMDFVQSMVCISLLEEILECN